ncbi:MAG TPA: S8 family serine peptidase [Chloroflexota bacterium]|nr:S8 family serine peptidase [Chloroflexota bacterium]
MLLILLALVPLGPATASSDPDLAPGRVIVKMRPGRGLRGAQATYGALAVEERPNLGAQVWRVAPGRETEVARRLAAQPDVEYAEPDRVARLYAAPNDPLYPTNQWNLPKIGAPQAWDITVGDGSVLVAVVDSGLDLGHPDRPANLLTGCDYVRWRQALVGGACPTVQDDPNGHGTHVAGILAARQNNGLGISGVAPGLSVLVIRTADETGASYASDVASAVREAVDAGARVINLSLGGPSSTTLQRSAIEYALGHGVVVVAAMGNEYQTGNPISYPAAYAGVVAVGAATHDDQHASYSNTGDHISLVAPGGNGDAVGDPVNWITSLWPWSRGGFALEVGTSQAAPHVAGTAGLMLSARPSLTGSEVAALLRSTARPLGGAVPNATFGYGYLDANAAVRAAQAGGAAPSPTPTPRPVPVPSLPIGWHRQHVPLAPRGLVGA